MTWGNAGGRADGIGGKAPANDTTGRVVSTSGLARRRRSARARRAGEDGATRA